MQSTRDNTAQLLDSSSLAWEEARTRELLIFPHWWSEGYDTDPTLRCHNETHCPLHKQPSESSCNSNVKNIQGMLVRKSFENDEMKQMEKIW